MAPTASTVTVTGKGGKPKLGERKVGKGKGGTFTYKNHSSSKSSKKSSKKGKGGKGKGGSISGSIPTSPPNNISGDTNDNVSGDTNNSISNDSSDNNSNVSNDAISSDRNDAISGVAISGDAISGDAISGDDISNDNVSSDDPSADFSNQQVLDFIMESTEVNSLDEQANFQLTTVLTLKGDLFEVIEENGSFSAGSQNLGDFKGFCTITGAEHYLCTYELYFRTNGDVGAGGITIRGPVTGERSVAVVTGTSFDYSIYDTGSVSLFQDPNNRWLVVRTELFLQG